MCRFCEQPCWRDGGERECELSDAEFNEYANGLPDDIERWDDGVEVLDPFCETCGWPESECQCGGGDWRDLDDAHANTRGDIA